MNPIFQEHADNIREMQEILAGSEDRTQGVTITIGGVVIPCTVSETIQDWDLADGKSFKTRVEQCEFLASDTASLQGISLIKGVRPVLLKQNPNDPGTTMMLWTGGFIEGGLVYRFDLVDINYSA
jgi:hypothetical protein